MILQGKSHRLWQPTRGGDSPLKENIPLVSAGNAWLSSVPAGEPILPLKVDKKGQVPSAHRVSQMLVGQIAMVPGDAATQPRYYVQLFDGLARTTYLDMRAMQSSDDQLGDPVRITNTQAANSISATMPELMTRGIPDGKPVGPEGYVSLRDSSVCLTYTEAAGQNPLISIGDETPPIPVGLSRPAMSLADVVSMAQVKGALVANVNTSGPDHASFLITGGLRYGLPTGWARRAIGYGDNVPVAKVNADLIKLIPNGLSQGAQLDKSSIKELR